MRTQSYCTDLNDEQWERLKALLPVAPKGRTGRPPLYERRRMLEAMLYQLRTGCQWRLLPKDFPPHEGVWELFRRWRAAGFFERVNAALRKAVREKAGRQEAPSAAILDSQSVKTTEKGNPKGSMSSRRSRAANGTSSSIPQGCSCR